MFLVNLLLVFCCIHFISGYPTVDTIDANESRFCNNFSSSIHYGVQELTPEEKKRFDDWTEDSNETIWSLSGQFQGDIVLSPHQQRNGRLGAYRWPSTRIPYKFSDQYTDEKDKRFIKQTLKRFKTRTCIDFYPATASDKYYIFITNIKGRGCNSYVGYQEAMQYLNLEKGCLKDKYGRLSGGSVMHEFVHALGFYHMQSDPARDKHVKIFWNNIKSGKEKNFCKYTDTEASSLGIPYDYDSIMHYGTMDFSKNPEEGEPTMYPLKPGVTIGKRRVLSQGDVDKINKMYECPPKKP